MRKYDKLYDIYFDDKTNFKCSNYYNIAEFVAITFGEFMKKLFEEDDENKLYDLDRHISNISKINKNMCDINKAKIILEVLKSKKPEEIEKIL